MTSRNGRQSKALVVFGAALKFFKNHLNHALKKINQSRYFPIREDKVLWIVTVPTVWSAKAKGFMRKVCLNRMNDEKSNRILDMLKIKYDW